MHRYLRHISIFRYKCTAIFREKKDFAFGWCNKRITPIIIYPSVTNRHIIPYLILEFQYGSFQKGFPTKILHAF